MNKRSDHLSLHRASGRDASFQRRHAHNYYIMGRRRAEEGATEDARFLLTRALAFDQQYVPALRSLASVELSLQHRASARGYLERALTISPHDPECYVLLGNIALGEQQPHEALASYAKATELGGNSPDLQFNTGLAHLLLSHGDEAAAIFTQLVTEQPANPRAWDALGCALRLLKDYPNAINAFVQALQLDHSFNEARDHLAQLLMETGNAHRACHVLESALALDPARANSRHLLGMAYASVQQFAKAVECWEALIHDGHDTAECYHLLANAYLHLDRDEEARRTLEILIERYPAHLPGQIQLALLLFDQGESERGYHYLDQARALDPHNPAVDHAFLTARILCPRDTVSPK